jgi:hypothetical protein
LRVRPCPKCTVVYSADRMRETARIGRLAAHSVEAQARRAETQRKHAVARYGWSQADQPEWLNSETYTREIQPRLARVTNSAIASALGVSLYYAHAFGVVGVARILGTGGRWRYWLDFLWISLSESGCVREAEIEPRNGDTCHRSVGQARVQESAIALFDEPRRSSSWFGGSSRRWARVMRSMPALFV